MELQDGLLTVTEAAKRAGLSAQRIRDLARAGRVEVVNTPYGRLVPRSEAERLATERAAKQPVPA